jgi:hypothetical protein
MFNHTSWFTREVRPITTSDEDKYQGESLVDFFRLEITCETGSRPATNKYKTPKTREYYHLLYVAAPVAPAPRVLI